MFVFHLTTVCFSSSMPSIGSPVTRVGSHKSFAYFKEWAQRLEWPTVQHVCSLLTAHTSDTVMTSCVCVCTLAQTNTKRTHFHSNETKYIIMVYLKVVGLEIHLSLPHAPQHTHFLTHLYLLCADAILI